jgi:uncharacterized membrane protein
MNNLFIFLQGNWLNLSAIIWFLVCFNGYMRYARARSYKSTIDSPSLASELHRYRYQWMLRVLTREMRIADNAAIANLEKSVSFFASTTMLILAGLMTILGSTEKAIHLIEGLPFAVPTERAEWEVKIIMLIFIFVYAFFKFTWSLRQYGFVTIMVGGAPLPSEQCTEEQRNALANRMASMASMAANNFNVGLRTYYFSISILTWFINPWLFMACSTFIVFILFRREFKSTTLKILTDASL